MTNFVHVDQPASHPGVVRAEALIDRLRAMSREFDGARGLAVLLLAAIVSSLLVVADKLMSTWSDGGLLVAWVVLWVVAFAALALFAGTARRLAARAVIGARNAASRRAAARADAQFLAQARFDPRILRELQAIATKHEVERDEGPASVLAPVESVKTDPQARIPTIDQALRQVRFGRYY